MTHEQNCGQCGKTFEAEQPSASVAPVFYCDACCKQFCEDALLEDGFDLKQYDFEQYIEEGAPE